MSKNKYVEIASRKVVSSYGGVGSIYETTKGAVMIRPFDRWDFINYRIYKAIKDNDLDTLNQFTIKDDRLLLRLKIHFNRLDRLINVPDNTSKNSYSSDPDDKINVIEAEYFPKWFYCNNCKSFKHISEWYKSWQFALSNINPDEITESFQEPKCNVCYLRGRNDAKNKQYKSHFNSNLCLEQVRFIMTAPNGKIKDLPWDRWNGAIKGSKDEEGGKIKLDYDELCCDNQDLEYKKSDTFEDYTGIRIKCRNCKKENSLSGLFGLKIRAEKEENIFYKPVLRSSNSVYYPIIFNSLFIPTPQNELSSEQINDINTLNKFGVSIAEISAKTSVPVCDIARLLNIETKQIIETESEYRLKEYDYILSDLTVSSDNNFIGEKVIADNLTSYFIKSLVKIKRLKMTSVQTGYTRQEPYDKDDFLQIGTPLKVQYTSSKANTTEILPAIESFGEGVFIEFDQKALENWYSKNQVQIDKRVKTIIDNRSKNEIQNNKSFKSNYHNAKFILIHTFSHLLIKEFEFLCGYPATSLSERLYVDTDMQGLLIYTIAGSEGSYGGLVSQATGERFEKLVRFAILRASDCASDPVCYNSEGQGIAGQNLAACYCCALLPENSCEEFNCNLDRALIIDSDYGLLNTCMT